MSVRKLELTFTREGHAELTEENDDDILWSSDDDDEFAERVDASEFLSEKNTEIVVEYLLEQSIITGAEEELLEVYEETDDNGFTEDDEGEIIDV